MPQEYMTNQAKVEALHWTGKNHRDVYMFLEGKTNIDAIYPDGDNFFIDHRRVAGGLILKMEVMGGVRQNVVYIGDYVLKFGGKFWPMDAQIFRGLFQENP